MDDCLRTSKPSKVNTKVNSTFYPSVVGKSSNGLVADVEAGAYTCVGWRLTLYDSIRQVTLG